MYSIPDIKDVQNAKRRWRLNLHIFTSAHLHISKFLVILLIIAGSLNSNAQSVSFDLKTNPTVDFTFSTIDQYIHGIYVWDAVILNVVATGTQWDLYVGTSTAVAGTMDNVQYYSNTGNGSPSVGLLQIQFRNSSNTPQVSGFVPLQSLLTTNLDIIGNHRLSHNPPVNCSDAVPKGTNTAGTYTVNPQCYLFKVDFRIVPGFTYRAGLYATEVDIIIAEDL